MKKFGYQSPQDTEVKEPEKVEKTDKEIAEEARQAVIEDARIALHSEPFKKMLEEYSTLERINIDALITLSGKQFDNELFANEARVLLSNIRHVRIMIENVHKKAGEEYGQESE